MKELILGGVRSGKSRLAERRAAACGRAVVYIATAERGDEGMCRRIEAHRVRRPAQWRTVESNERLALSLQANDGAERCLLVDCLTLWLTRLIGRPAILAAETQALLDVLPRLSADVVMVSNEVGLGVIPMGEISRGFVDAAGRLHQQLAERCDRVTFVAAGLPLTLKEPAA